MAETFDPPFAHEGELRDPTPQEVAGGFPCGPADQALFNGLFNRLEGNIGEVIKHAGVVPSAAKMGLREAIEALIAAATGGGDTSQFLLISQARARLPIFPEVLNADGRISVVSPGEGVVRLAGGVDFIHRGIFPLTTAQTNFITNPSKTYHLRWSPAGGFELKDLSAGAYNPTLAAETDAKFDSTYDDMLVARVITNSSNVPSITQLANKARLTDRKLESTNAGITNNGAPAWSYFRTFNTTQNWARTPSLVMPQGWITSAIVNRYGLQGSANVVDLQTVNRYVVNFQVGSDFDAAQSNPAAGYLLNIGAF